MVCPGLSQLFSGEGWVTPWTSHLCITGDTDTDTERQRNRRSRTYSQFRLNFEFSVLLTCMFLECGRKLENLLRTHVDTVRTPHRKTSQTNQINHLVICKYIYKFKMARCSLNHWRGRCTVSHIAQRVAFVTSDCVDFFFFFPGLSLCWVQFQAIWEEAVTPTVTAAFTPRQ